jgi:hypothetical protein
MERDRTELMELIQQIMWYMRGGVTREDAWNLSPVERNSIVANIKKRVETVEETGLPLI